MQFTIAARDFSEWIHQAIKDPNWWSALFTGLATLIAILAFIAAWRAAKAAIRTYRLQQEQLGEMSRQTTTMLHVRKEDALYGLSIWVAGSEPEKASLKYVNTTGHPVYNVKIELSRHSDEYHAVPVLEPQVEPAELGGLTDSFQQSLHMATFYERPGTSYQFDTHDGERYIRNMRGGLHSVGGNPIDNSPRTKWRPW